MTARDEGAGTMDGSGLVDLTRNWEEASKRAEAYANSSRASDFEAAEAEGRAAGLKMCAAELRALLAAPVSAPGMERVDWQPIETAPHDRFVLLYNPPRDELLGYIAMAKWQGGSWYGVDEDGLTFNPLQAWDFVSHWRDLPAHPKTPQVEGESSREEPIPSTPPFIQWNGGENPAPGKVVEVRYKLSTIVSGAAPSSQLCWEHAPENSPVRVYDIIAYRIIPTDGAEADA